MSTTASKPARITSLDQFRGYTVFGMFVVNFLGGFTYCPEVLRHSHNYLSYADTIMPHFLFAVGFAFRLTFGRRIHSAGAAAAYRRVVTRFVGLMLVAIVVYGAGRVAGSWDELKHIGVLGALYEPLKREWFQTLMHIACTALWITPVIRSSAMVRVGYLFFSAILHIVLSHMFNFEWCSTSPNVIDGGPVGVLTWAVPALMGTLVCDAVVGSDKGPNLFKLFAWSILIMVIGYGMSCGTRFYDLTPSQMEEMEKEYERQGEERKAYSRPIGPLAHKRGELQKEINRLTELIEGRLGVERVEDEVKREELIAKREELIAEDHKLRAEIEKISEAFTAYRDGSEPFVVKRFHMLNAMDGVNAKLNGTKAVPKVTDEAKRAELEKKKEELTAGIAEAEAEIEKIKAEKPGYIEPKQRRFREAKLALDPVIPSQERIDGLKKRYEEQGYKALLAEPPFVYPVHTMPGPGKRSRMMRNWNYWMISQRQGTLSYTFFAGGLSIFVYALFYIACDIWGLQIPMFRTFGTNALIAYCLHGMVGGSVKTFMPRDVPSWYMYAGCALFIFITWLFVRVLEKNNIYIKL